MSTHKKELNDAISCLQKGGVIAYPTEAVYGLGCDPFNIDAVARILQIKRRGIKKGFILLASEWEQLEPFVESIDPPALARVFSTWPGPVTWVFPATPDTPLWIRGGHTSIAARITDHPIAKSLCDLFDGPIISTSANRTGYPPVRNEKTLRLTLGNEVDVIVPGEVGTLHQPTEIRDAITGEVLRPG